MIASNTSDDTTRSNESVDEWTNIFRAYFFHNLEIDPRVTLPPALHEDAVRYSSLPQASYAPQVVQLLGECTRVFPASCPLGGEFEGSKDVLLGLGFRLDDDGDAWKFDNNTQVEKIKSTVRKSFHHTNTMVRYTSFIQIVAALNAKHNKLLREMKQGGSEKDRFLAHRTFISEFVAKYRGNVELAPVIVTLRSFLEKQIGSKESVQWVVNDSQLVERGDVKFVDDLAELVQLHLDCHVQSAIQDVATATFEELYQGTHMFTINSQVSDQHLQYLMDALPGGLKGQSIGKFVNVEASERGNMDGREDTFTPPHWIVSGLYETCDIL